MKSKDRYNLWFPRTKTRHFNSAAILMTLKSYHLHTRLPSGPHLKLRWLPEKVWDGHHGVFAPLCVVIPLSACTIKWAQQFYALLEAEVPAQGSFPLLYLHRSYPWALWARTVQPLPAPPSLVYRIFVKRPINAGAFPAYSVYDDALPLCSCSPESVHEERCLKMQ